MKIGSKAWDKLTLEKKKEYLTNAIATSGSIYSMTDEQRATQRSLLGHLAYLKRRQQRTIKLASKKEDNQAST
jgi:hypothetical protein